MLALLAVLGPVIYPALGSLATAAIGWIAASINTHMAAQTAAAKQLAANTAIQAAVKNFAGSLLTKASVVGTSLQVVLGSGRIELSNLKRYLWLSLPEAMDTIGGISDETLLTMLNGKLAELGMIVQDESGTVTTPVPGAPTADDLGLHNDVLSTKS